MEYINHIKNWFLSQEGAFKCQGLGHMASKYPTWKVVALIKEDEIEEEDKEEDFNNCVRKWGWWVYYAWLWDFFSCSKDS